MNAIILCAAAPLAVLLAAPAGATLTAWDSFAVGSGWLEYGPGPIQDQNPLTGCGGFFGGWNSGTSAFVVTSGGLAHPMTPGTLMDGRLIAYTSNGSATRVQSRLMSGEPTTGTYYMSVLLQKNAFTSTRDLMAGLGAWNDVEPVIFDVYASYIGFVDGGISFFAPGAQIWQLMPSAQVNVNETYFALLQYDYSTSGPDAITATVYNGASTQVAHQTMSGLALDGSLACFSLLTQEFGPMVAIDEWRLGTALADVMVAPATPGDFDRDNDVDGADLLKWQRGESPQPLGADDLTAWRTNFGPGAILCAAHAIPEPASAVLASALLAGGVARARRSGAITRRPRGSSP